MSPKPPTSTRTRKPPAPHDHATEAAATETTAHSHGDEAATADHEPTGDAAAAAHEHTDDATPAQAVAAAAWPRPWDPTQPIDFSGVPGVTPEQQARAEALVKTTLEQLPQFADVSTLPALGYRSIGDAVHRARALHQHGLHRGRRVPRPVEARSPSCTPSTVTSARSCQRCSSPTTVRSMIRSSSISAAASCNGTSTRTCAGV